MRGEIGLAADMMLIEPALPYPRSCRRPWLSRNEPTGNSRESRVLINWNRIE